MKRIFTRIAAGLLLAMVAFLSAAVTLRLFLHGREVSVPSLAGLSDADAARVAKKLGLNISVENRFYSAGVTPNHVLSQSPIAGSRVRRGWQIRVTESLGGQHIDIPDVTGQGERPASLILRRLSLEVAPAAHLAAPGAGIILAQSPPANAEGLAGPRIAFLVADDESSAAAAAAYVMPQITGMTIYAANAHLASAGLRIGSATDPAYAPPPPASADPTAPPLDPAIPPTVTAPPPVSSSAIIATQFPAPGHKVTRTDRIAVTIGHPASPTSTTLVP